MMGKAFFVPRLLVPLLDGGCRFAGGDGLGLDALLFTAAGEGFAFSVGLLVGVGFSAVGLAVMALGLAVGLLSATAAVLDPTEAGPATGRVFSGVLAPSDPAAATVGCTA